MWLQDTRNILENTKGCFKENKEHNFSVINRILLPHMVYPQALSIFDESRGMQTDDKLVILEKWFLSREFKMKYKSMAEAFEQGTLDFTSYIVKKLKMIRVAFKEDSEDERVQRVLQKMAPQMREKIGLHALDFTTVADLYRTANFYASTKETIVEEKKENIVEEKKEKNEKNFRDNNYWDGRRSSGPNNNNNFNGNYANNNYNNNSNNKNNNNSITCWKCHMVGHLQRNCPQRNNSNARFKVNAIGSPKLYDAMDIFEQGIELKMLEREVTMVEVSVGKNREELMIDSCSTITLVDPRVEFEEEQSVNVVVRFANGTIERLTKRRRLRVFLKRGTHLFVWAFVCSKLPARILMGTDYLQNNVIINFLRRHVWFRQIKTSGEFSGAIVIDEEEKKCVIDGEYYPCLRGLPQKWYEMVVSWIKKFNALKESKGWLVSEAQKFSIEWTDEFNVSRKPRAYSDKEHEIIVEKLLPLLKGGVLVPSRSRNQVPVVLVSQAGHDGTVKHRVCGDYVPYNSKTIRKTFPMPVSKQLASRITGKFKTIIDADSGYLRIGLEENSYEKTAIILDRPIPGYGDKLEYRVMPYGVMNGGEHYQPFSEALLRPMERFPENLKGECAEVYLDDTILHDDTEELHFYHVNQVFARMYEKKLPPNFKKLQLFKETVKWCGMILSPEGVSQNPEKIEGLTKLGYPRDYNENNKFIGFCLWHHEFVPDFAGIMAPLYDLKRRGMSRIPFNFTEECKKAFHNIISEIKKRVLLSYPERGGEYHIYSDMSKSNRSISAHLVQVKDGRVKLLAYTSKLLNDTEREYGAPMLELMAMWYPVIKWKHMLRGNVVRIFTDHKSLRKIELSNLRGRHATWMMDIAEVFPSIEYRPGVLNIVPDAMTWLTNANEYIRKSAGISHVAGAKVVPLIIVDPVEKKTIIDYYHKEGHFSDRKTVQNIRTQYDWEGIYHDVEEARKRCDYCLRNKNNGENRTFMTPMKVPSKPWEIVGLDLLGPFILKDGGMRWGMIAVDYLTKDVVLTGTDKHDAVELIRKFDKHVKETRGTPVHVVGDRAKQYLGDKFVQYCVSNGIEFTPSTSFHQQANGQVEGIWKTAKSSLHSFIDKGVPFRQALLETRRVMSKILVSDTTLMTAHQALYGEAWNSPIHNLIMMRRRRLENIRADLTKNSIEAKKKQEEYYNQGKKIRQLEENDWVMVENHYKRGFIGDKRVGPFRVEKKLPNDNYLIFNHLRHVWSPVNIQYLTKVEMKDIDYNMSDFSVRTPGVDVGKMEWLADKIPKEAILTPVPGKMTVPKSKAQLDSTRRVLNFNSPTKPVDEMIGRRIRVEWEVKDEKNKYTFVKKWFPGVIVANSDQESEGTHNVLYDDEKEKGLLEPIIEPLTAQNVRGEKSNWEFET
jgi:hypothetical protein